LGGTIKGQASLYILFPAKTNEMRSPQEESHYLNTDFELACKEIRLACALLQENDEVFCNINSKH
jgi:hypothetical protein